MRKNSSTQVQQTMYFLFRILGIVAFSIMQGSVIAMPVLEDVQRVANSGAPSLALHIMEDVQSGLMSDMTQWSRWEKERLGLYRQRAAWQEIINRVSMLPRTAPLAFRLHAQTEQAQAYLNLGKPAQARAKVQDLIWSTTDSELANHWQKPWRRLIIDTYLQEGLIEDAVTANARYQQDFAADTVEDKLISARVLLLAHRTDDVLRLLKHDHNTGQAEVVWLLAQVRSREYSPQKILKRAVQLANTPDRLLESQSHSWLLVAEAALRTGDRTTAIEAMENILMRYPAEVSTPEFMRIDSNLLWNAYLEQAMQYAQREKFVDKDYEIWIRHADNLVSRQPQLARSLFALLLVRGENTELQEQAAARFVMTMANHAEPHGLYLNLFLNSRYYPDILKIPEPIRYVLIDAAFATGQSSLAAELFATLRVVPTDGDSFLWQLKRARVLLLNRQVNQGVEGLMNLLAVQQELDPKQFRLIMQMILDMQRLNKHEQTLAVLEQIVRRVNRADMLRELYYTMAQSHKAMQLYQHAAFDFMNSAAFGENESSQHWSDMMRGHAAAVLVQAGLYDDARTLYQRLIQTESNAEKKQILQRELDKISGYNSVLR